MSQRYPAVAPPELLYDERDACGVGFVAAGDGRPARAVPGAALQALRRLRHRGGLAADGKTGDGAGVTTDVPVDFFRRELQRLDLPVPEGPFGVAVCFLPRDRAAREVARALLAEACSARALRVLGWRTVPVDSGVLGRLAERTRPAIEQAFIVAADGADVAAPDTGDLERRLYLARRAFEGRVADVPGGPAYVASMSARVVVYKGLMMADQMEAFYPDLADAAFVSRFAVFHQRYSTNTTPSWERAQPYRRLGHNGEINTLQGNVNGIAAREPGLAAPDWPDASPEAWRPVIDLSGSDSAMLDNVVELMSLTGRELPHVMTMLVPEAWERVGDLSPELKDFYRFHAFVSEPWDGPAALVFADGNWVGARLDRNGLRPMRYAVLDDGTVLAGSEAGVFDLDPARVRVHGKLGPGQMIAVDLRSGRYFPDAEIKRALARRRPYGRWVRRHALRLADVAPAAGDGARGDAAPAGAQPPAAAFGYTREELTVIVRPMVQNAKEPNGSMGDDTPHAVLSQMRRPLYHYFKQRFAQVTNPAIDHLRERFVFSLTARLGPRPNLLAEAPQQARAVELESPFLTDARLRALKRLHPDRAGYGVAVLDAVFPAAAGPEGLEAGVRALAQQAVRAVDAGAGILVLSDRSVDADHAPIPALLATGAVHHQLIREDRGARASLVVESGEPREVHHMAALIGYGADAVNPYLALAVAREVGAGRKQALEPGEAARRYLTACEEGLMKVMSKMGISTVDAYRGAQIFEAVGLSREVVDRCFHGTPSRVGGNGFREIGEDALHWHRLAFTAAGDGAAAGYGFYKFKKDGEHHDFSPRVVRALQDSARGGDHEHYRDFARLTREKSPSQLRDLLELRAGREPVPLDEVEPAASIARRFSTAAMSLGSISPEAHETLAAAMNRLGGRSNSGEGGEDPARFGTERNSGVKQVASGRFGVTAAYLASGRELQIKMAQGSKPGEGGQIPGHKVSGLIARLRHTVPGVGLISPPPHHDIYSIEDLAQLIYDLKQSNPDALVSVKLVAETGVGIIAAGVAKGFADVVQISGHAGGTGSSPLSSIKNAGLPWELGLVETQRALVENDLRSRIAVRVDGGFKTGRDVVVAALLGADEYSFGTAALVAEGCIMARACHLNSCPVGIATQRQKLRDRFPGRPEQVVSFFLHVAGEVREILAGLGHRSLDEVIGRAELLRQRATGHARADRLDLGPLLAPPGGVEGPRRRTRPRNDPPPDDALGRAIAEELRPCVEARRRVERRYRLDNAQRTVGATLAWEIARRYGDEGLPSGTLRLRFEGVAGQSFGAFCARGMELSLTGAANDYVGKGMGGGEIVVRPGPGGPDRSDERVLVGNTVLYGATGGSLFVAGAAGERFAIRNSGAAAVVEATGDHACEYMTGGTVVILGRVGHNLGGGMTGGEAWVYDPEGALPHRYNRSSVAAAPAAEQPREDVERLRRLVRAHLERTGSRRARGLLRRWPETLCAFSRIRPLDAEPTTARPRAAAQSAD